jgi:6,7-dimethyl-8-ribityllumazine synthase
MADGTGVRVGICFSQSALLAAECKAALLKCKVTEDDVVMSPVPAVLDLPYAASRMILTQGVDVVVCIGTLVRGEPPTTQLSYRGGGLNFDVTLQTVSQGIMQISLESGIPVVSGVVGCSTEEEVRMIFLFVEHATKIGNTGNKTSGGRPRNDVGPICSRNGEIEDCKPGSTV